MAVSGLWSDIGSDRFHLREGHAVQGRCRRKIEMSPGAQSRNDTPGPGSTLLPAFIADYDARVAKPPVKSEGPAPAIVRE